MKKVLSDSIIDNSTDMTTVPKTKDVGTKDSQFVTTIDGQPVKTIK
jgi:hypothetical protein